MKRLLTLKAIVLIVAYSQFANADAGWAKAPRGKQIKVAVIDTGISPELLKGNSYCKSGHKDFTNTGLDDRHGHGTHISGIVDQYAKNYIFTFGKSPKKIDELKENYCQIIIKFFDPKQGMFADNLAQTKLALRWAIDQKVNIINYSGGGTEPSKEEKALIVEALDKGIIIVAAAGNERSDIDKHKYYPAMYDKRIHVVGNLVKLQPREIANSSNRGESVTDWEIGTNVLSRLPDERYGLMTGTSQATAIKTGKLVREMLLHP